MPYILALDQGTTSTRAIVFDQHGAPLASGARVLEQHYPADGWVEHDPEAIWSAARATMREAVSKAGLEPSAISAIGITNQRETTLIWDRATGEPLHRAIVWQDRRTADACARAREAGLEDTVRARTGLLLDPYFSATKIAWLLDHCPGARARAERGEVLFGTVDSFLLWRLTAGAVHATDATNASRTMLFDIVAQDWDDELLRAFAIPRAMLPAVMDSSADFGVTCELGPAIPILGIAGDQQAAAIGQACVKPGMAKATFGTGCFVLVNTGSNPLPSRHRMLSTVAWRIDGRAAFALEGSVFNAGTIVQWLRDRLHAIPDAASSEAVAAALPDNRGVHLVPAFTGLGAPYWDPHARGTITGLTRDSGSAEIVRAGLESVAYQVRDLLDAMAADGARPIEMRVDGGMTANAWLMGFVADVCALRVRRPVVTETTALGAAMLAGLRLGIYPPLARSDELWRHERDFMPTMAADHRDRLQASWHRAVERSRG